VDGVRIDVAHGFTKAAGLPDLGDLLAAYRPLRLGTIAHASDQEGNHAVFRRWRRLADAYDPPRVLAGEVNLPADRQWRYTRPGELHQAFSFDLVGAPWDGPAWLAAVRGLLAGRDAGGAPVTWVVENHDVVRTPTRYGSAGRARAALLAVLGLPGSAYLYQGQELGLPEVEVPPDRVQDPAAARTGTTRDGARVPVPWTTDPAGTHGFSPAGAEPWLPVPAGWGALSVQAQEADPASVLALTRRAVALRRRLHGQGVLSADDRAEVALTGDGVLLARRPSGFTLAVAMGEHPAPLPDGELLLASGDLPGRTLPPGTAAWLR
jgi:alpha-glucosidase